MSRDAEKRIQIMAQYLYDRMPDAPRVPTEGGFKMWGDVEGTPHYEFCEAIANLLERVDVRTHVKAD